jgi:hypothetical protein
MKSVTIVGKGRGYEDAPLDNGSVIWAITQMNLRIPCHLVIDMNDYTLWGKREELEAQGSKKMAELNEVPYIDRDNYPLHEITKRFEVDYFTSTVAYAIALAVHQGFDEINLYGVPLEHHTEYAHQRPCVEFWIGVAKGRGILVNIYGEHSTLLKDINGKLYGYNLDQEWKKEVNTL